MKKRIDLWKAIGIVGLAWLVIAPEKPNDLYAKKASKWKKYRKRLPKKLYKAIRKAKYLSGLEKEVLFEHNEARLHPKRFAKKLKKFLKYYKGNRFEMPGKVPIITKEGAKAVKEAILFLKKQKKLPALYPSRGLSKAAKYHALDQEKSGKLGHYGSDGSTPFQRMNRYGKWLKTAGENIDYGKHNGFFVVASLIIDDGVANRGHRLNIFNPKFRKAGVGCAGHKVYQQVCVITYAGGYTEKK